jgi:NitT/TauT family transport system permease protein
MSRGAGSELELSEAARLAENNNLMRLAEKPESVGLPARRRRGMSRFGTAGNVPLTLVVLLLLWEISVRVAEVPMYLVPPPSAVIYRMVTDWKLLLDQTRVTTFEVVIGFVLAIIISIPLAAILSQWRWLEQTVYPVLVASQTLPKVAIAPLFVVWFGFGIVPNTLITFLMCFFPIVVDSLIGFRSVPKEVLWLTKSTGASNWNVFFKVQIPAAHPSIFAGIKVASTLAVVGAVVGEFVGADSGLGYQLIVANGTLDVQLSFAVLIVLSVLGIALFGLVVLAERVLLPWHISQRHNKHK